MVFGPHNLKYPLEVCTNQHPRRQALSELYYEREVDEATDTSLVEGEDVADFEDYVCFRKEQRNTSVTILMTSRSVFPDN